MSNPQLRRRALQTFWAATAVVTFNSQVATLKHVSGGSMRPTLNPDSSPVRDLILFDRTAAWRDMLDSKEKKLVFQRGDVVYLMSPEHPGRLLVKRIVALEGDTIEPLERYSGTGPVRIPKNHVWVEGDEPLGRDSNTFGPVSANLLQGRAICIVWPPNRFGKLPSADDLQEDDHNPWSVPRRLAAREKARDARLQRAYAQQGE